MPSASAPDVTVVIRSVGERSEALCRRLLTAEVPAAQIVTVSNAPFTATLADSYRAGIAGGRTWTLCIDADVLVRPGVVSELLAIAARADASVCEVQGLVLDKFFGVRRPAGNHLYRTALLPTALRLIPDAAQAIRPEHFTLSQMTERGFAWLETPCLIGLHDFEQHDADVFRKCFVHARKFDHLLHLLLDYWRRRAADDRDYRVALAGVAAGILSSGTVAVDARVDRGFAKWAADESWSSKPPLAPDALAPADVERILSTWTSPGEALARYEAACAREMLHRRPGAAAPAPAVSAGGLLRRVPRVMGRALGRAGRRLERLAS